MNSAPHLLAEDRPEFERVLDEALRDESLRATMDARAGRSPRVTRGQLRTMALSASAAISACAAGEYEDYVRARQQGRDDAARPADAAQPADEAGEPTDVTGGVARAVSGAGIVPVITVLTPILSGTAAVIFLLVGYVLSAMRPEPAIAGPLRTAGWLFLAIAGVGVLLGTVGMVLTAVRDGSSAIHAAEQKAPDEVTTARRAWSAALLERGMLPFLHEALAKAAAGPADAPGTARDGRPPGRGRGRSGSQSPPLGYSRPGFSSPSADEPRSSGPRFSSPDFSSPDYSSPDFSSPDDGA